MKYKTKIKEIEAIQWDGTDETLKLLQEWDKDFYRYIYGLHVPGYIENVAIIGDYIINNNYWYKVIHKEEFEKAYEAADE